MIVPRRVGMLLMYVFVRVLHVLGVSHVCWLRLFVHCLGEIRCSAFPNDPVWCAVLGHVADYQLLLPFEALLCMSVVYRALPSIVLVRPIA